MKIIVSSQATRLPIGNPQTDDMRAMIDHFERLGLIQRIPAAFTVGQSLVLHPALAAKLRANRKSRR